MNRFLFFSSIALFILAIVLAILLVSYRQKYKKYREIARKAKSESVEVAVPGLDVLTKQIRKECGEASPVPVISMVVCSYVHAHCLLEGENDEPDYRKAIAKIADGGKPFSLCGVRAKIMKELCAQMGVVSRIVHAFNLKEKDILSHSFTETYNPSSGDWELYDPYFNVCATSDGGRHYGVLGLTKAGFAMVPCSSAKTEDMDWIKSKFKDYSDAFILESTDSHMGIKNPIVLIPQKKQLPDKFRVWCEKNYGASTFIYMN